MNAKTTLNPTTGRNPLAEQPARKRYLVDFYDNYDYEWANGSEPTFDNFQEAIEACDRMQARLPKGNRDFGDHYGVINLEIGRELYCAREVLAFAA